ncbi:MAG: YdeI/OmpD-associated family protein [Chloroflexota bacterium]|nr:YdeI/OmpD-associated family protein [Chloroflexota bacterium]
MSDDRLTKVTKTLYVHRVADWRTWLRKHHKTSREIWLVYYRKETGQPRISYNDAVDEALCFGWIDSTQKKIDADRTAQRYTPRRPGSPTSEMNKARARRLVREKRMTPAGLEAIGSLKTSRLVIAPDIRAAFERDPIAWKRFQRFPASYRRIRIAFVEGARGRPDEFKRRLGNLVRKSAKNERFGMVRE